MNSHQEKSLFWVWRLRGSSWGSAPLPSVFPHHGYNHCCIHCMRIEHRRIYYWRNIHSRAWDIMTFYSCMLWRWGLRQPFVWLPQAWFYVTHLMGWWQTHWSFHGFQLRWNGYGGWTTVWGEDGIWGLHENLGRFHFRSLKGFIWLARPYWWKRRVCACLGQSSR